MGKTASIGSRPPDSRAIATATTALPLWRTAASKVETRKTAVGAAPKKAAHRITGAAADKGPRPSFSKAIPDRRRARPMKFSEARRKGPSGSFLPMTQQARNRGEKTVQSNPSRNVTAMAPTLAPITAARAPDSGSRPASTRPTAREAATELLCVPPARMAPKANAPDLRAASRPRALLNPPPNSLPNESVRTCVP